MKDPRQSNVSESTVVLVCRDIVLNGEDRTEIERSEAALAHVFMRLRREREAFAMATLALTRHPGDRHALEVIEATREGD